MEAFKGPRSPGGNLVDSLLEEIGPDAAAAVPELIELLRKFSQDPDSRRKLIAEPTSVCNILGAIGSKAKLAVPWLVHFMEKEREDNVRTAAALALVEIGSDPPALEQVLTSLLANKDVEVRCEAIRTVYAPGHIGSRSPALRQILVTRLDDPQPEVRLAAARALWTLNHDSTSILSTLVNLLLGERLDPFAVRAEVLRSLGEMGPQAKRAIPQIHQMLVRESYEILKALALVALRRIQGPSADLDRQLVALLEKSPIIVVDRAISQPLLRSKGPLQEVTLRAIRHMADDANGIVEGRFMFETIWSLGSDAAPLVPFLREALVDHDSMRRQMAARALGAIGLAARPALVALLRLARLDNDFLVRLQASDAVERILRF